jgi:digeranylgeranylglycerophospholipid reductase
VALYAPNGKNISIADETTRGVVLERKIFDKLLAIDAARKGAHFLPKTLATEIVKEVDNAKINKIKTINADGVWIFSAPLVVFSEGMEAKLARQAGFNTLATLYDIDSCFEYEMANVECKELIEIYFSNKLAPRGYHWVFPKGKDVANVGVGVGGATGANPKECLDAFIKANPKQFGKAEVVEIKAGNISVGAPINELVKDGLMVVGTAAHQVDPIHGGGIGLAMEAGILAGEVAADAWRKKDFTKKMLYEYEKKWREKEQKKL